MYSAYNLNKQGGNVWLWRTPFQILNQFIFPCLVLTVASWPAYRFLRKQLRWSGIPISLRIFQFVVIHTVKGFRIVSEAVVYVFLEFSCSFCDSTDIGNLPLVSLPFLNPVGTSGSSQFTYCWSLKDFEHYFASMWNEYNCAVVWTFLDLAFLWD